MTKMTRSKISKELQMARPRLKIVSPLSHWIVTIMAVFNLVLGASLLFAIDSSRFTASLIIVNDILTYQFWGVVFIAIGLLKLYSIYINDWNLSRKTLILGVSVKATWAVALTIRTFISPGTLFVNLIWVTIAALQMACYIWFMPPATTLGEDKRLTNGD